MQYLYRLLYLENRADVLELYMPLDYVWDGSGYKKFGEVMNKVKTVELYM